MNTKIFSRKNPGNIMDTKHSVWLRLFEKQDSGRVPVYALLWHRHKLPCMPG